MVYGLEVDWLAIDYLLDGYNVIDNDGYILQALYMAIDLGKLTSNLIILASRSDPLPAHR